MRTAYTTSALALVATAAAAFSTDANAILLTQGDANYIGFVKDGDPADPVSEVNRINSLLDLAINAPVGVCTQIAELCDRIGSSLDVTGFADAVTTGVVKNESGASTNIDVTGYSYLLGKYDGGNFGDLIWYVGNLTGLHSIQAAAGSQPWALSHYSLFNPGTTVRVPEPATLTLLSLGLLGVGFTASRRRRLSA